MASGTGPTTCSDSEVITVAVVSDCYSWTTETRLVQEWQRYRSLIPRLPEHSRCTRRRRKPMGAGNQICHRGLMVLDVVQNAGHG